MRDGTSPGTQQASHTGTAAGDLGRNALGLSGLVLLGTAYMGLALAAYFNFGIMAELTGPIVPLTFVAVTVVMLPTAASYAVMNRERPSTGSTLTWLWEATVPRLGVWLGWILVITYVVGAALQPVMFGVFFNSFLSYFGVRPDALTAIAGGVSAVLIVAILTKQDIRLSARSLSLFIGVEAGFVAFLAVYVMVKQGLAGHLSWQPVIPSRATSWSGFVAALLFGVLSIAAFDIVAPVAEEARSPRSLVPRATILVTLGAGAYWAFTSFGIVSSVSAKGMAAYVRSGQVTPVYLVAAHYLGAAKVLVPITGFTATVAALSAVSIAASRQLFALARARVAPKMFAVTNRHKTPWNAQLPVLACCLVVPVVVILYQNSSPLQAFMWIGQAYVFLILIPYTLTCLANIVYHLRYRAMDVNWLTHLLLPALGIVVNCYILYKNFLQTFVFNPTNFRTQTSITVACFALIALASAVTLIGVRKNSRVLAPGPASHADATDPIGVTTASAVPMSRPTPERGPRRHVRGLRPAPEDRELK
jgi:amino acid transporter